MFTFLVLWSIGAILSARPISRWWIDGTNLHDAVIGRILVLVATWITWPVLVLHTLQFKPLPESKPRTFILRILDWIAGVKPYDR
jgi:hypothetical protein